MLNFLAAHALLSDDDETHIRAVADDLTTLEHQVEWIIDKVENESPDDVTINPKTFVERFSYFDDEALAKVMLAVERSVPVSVIWEETVF